jgi:hypothetical protein
MTYKKFLTSIALTAAFVGSAMASDTLSFSAEDFKDKKASTTLTLTENLHQGQHLKISDVDYAVLSLSALQTRNIGQRSNTTSLDPAEATKIIHSMVKNNPKSASLNLNYQESTGLWIINFLAHDKERDIDTTVTATLKETAPSKK